ADDYWKGAAGVEGDWNNSANWVSGAVPENEIGFVNNGGYAVIPDGSFLTNLTIALGQDLGASGTVRIEPGAVITDTKLLAGNVGNGRGLFQITGGTIDTGTKDFVLAQASSSATGVVVMTGGEVTAQTLYVGKIGSGFFTLSNGMLRTRGTGYVGHTGPGSFMQEGGTNSFDNGADLYLARNANAQGAYTLNNGTLICSDYTYLGYSSGAQGTLTVNGGSLITSNNVVLGSVSGGRGVMTVNGGNGNWQALGSNLRVGHEAGTFGSLTLNGHTNTFTTVNVGNYSGSTGLVAMTESDITVSNGLLLSGATNEVEQSGGRLAVTAGDLTLNGTVSSRFTARDGAAVSANRISVSQTGTLWIEDAAVTVTNAAANAEIEVACGGQLDLDGGVIACDALDLPAGTAGARPTVRIRDGWFGQKGNLTVNAGHHVMQSGGEVTNAGFYVYGSAAQPARVEISGGAFTVAPANYAIFNSGTSELRLKGSAPQVTVPMFSYVGGGLKEFLLEYTLDQSPAHLAPVNFTGNAYRCGHLRVALDGGALLLRTNAFALMTGVKSSTHYYTSLPDSNLWSVQTLLNTTSGVALASGSLKGALSAGGVMAAGPFDPAPMGHVEIANLKTNRLIALNVRLALTPGAKTLEQVVADFAAAGFTNSAVEAEGGYNVRLTIPAAEVPDRSAAPTAWFAWDFTRTPSITNVTAVVTNATLTALKVELEKLPDQGTLIQFF
ncbi:MAG: hypothetical protein RBT78_13320, partial [Kiritimatiellia bacterium]|nr:hypothetical protein [Kiritimatiellia bacterium]